MPSLTPHNEAVPGDPYETNLECALEALEAARDHLQLAARRLTRHTLSGKQPRGRRLLAMDVEIRRIALEVSLIPDLLEP